MFSSEQMRHLAELINGLLTYRDTAGCYEALQLPMIHKGVAGIIDENNRLTVETIIVLADQSRDSVGMSIESARNREIIFLITMDKAPSELRLPDHLTNFMQDDLRAFDGGKMEINADSAQVNPVVSLLHAIYRSETRVELIEKVQSSAVMAGSSRISNRSEQAMAELLFQQQVNHHGDIPMIAVYDLQLNALVCFEQKPQLLRDMNTHFGAYIHDGVFEIKPVKGTEAQWGNETMRIDIYTLRMDHTTYDVAYTTGTPKDIDMVKPGFFESIWHILDDDYELVHRSVDVFKGTSGVKTVTIKNEGLYNLAVVVLTIIGAVEAKNDKSGSTTFRAEVNGVPIVQIRAGEATSPLFHEAKRTYVALYDKQQLVDSTSYRVEPANYRDFVLPEFNTNRSFPTDGVLMGRIGEYNGSMELRPSGFSDYSSIMGGDSLQPEKRILYLPSPHFGPDPYRSELRMHSSPHNSTNNSKSTLTSWLSEQLDTVGKKLDSLFADYDITVGGSVSIPFWGISGEVSARDWKHPTASSCTTVNDYKLGYIERCDFLDGSTSTCTGAGIPGKSFGVEVCINTSATGQQESMSLCAYSGVRLFKKLSLDGYGCIDKKATAIAAVTAADTAAAVAKK